MDALSSQATVGGYKAALIAADSLPRFLPMLTTAAGTVQPAKVLVIGAGVAGLQAIATAAPPRRGASTASTCATPSASRSSRSARSSSTSACRARRRRAATPTELTPEQQAQQQAELEKRLPDYDAVITTAAIPGRPAPKLIPATAVQRDAPRLRDRRPRRRDRRQLRADAARRGGRPRRRHDRRPAEPAERDALHASQLYARNVQALLNHLAPEGELVLDFEDEITAGACVTRKETPSA